MPDKSPKDIERIVKKARSEDREAEKAKRVVDEAETQAAHPRQQERES